MTFKTINSDKQGTPYSDAVELGELDALIEKQAQFGRRVTQKS